MRRILVVAAMTAETRALRRRLVAVKRFGWLGRKAWAGQLDAAASSGEGAGPEIWVVHCGVGRNNARALARRVALLGQDKAQRAGFERCLVVGLCGGLAPDLVAGELVLIGTALDGENALTAAMQLSTGDRPAPPLGTAVTVSDVVVDTPGKKRLWQRAGAPQKAVVDMETWELARGLLEVLEIRVARVVSDGPSEQLPGYLAGPDGAVWWRVLFGVVRRPSTVMELLKLRKRMAQGAETLADWVVQESGG